MGHVIMIRIRLDDCRLETTKISMFTSQGVDPFCSLMLLSMNAVGKLPQAKATIISAASRFPQQD